MKVLKYNLPSSNNVLHTKQAPCYDMEFSQGGAAEMTIIADSEKGRDSKRCGEKFK